MKAQGIPYTCHGCGSDFSPKVAKIGLRFCCADCLYDCTYKIATPCEWCGDEFVKEFTKTLAGCCEDCDNLLGVKLLNNLSRRFAMDHDSYALILVSQKILELTQRAA